MDFSEIILIRSARSSGLITWSPGEAEPSRAGPSWAGPDGDPAEKSSVGVAGEKKTKVEKKRRKPRP